MLVAAIVGQLWIGAGTALAAGATGPAVSECRTGLGGTAVGSNRAAPAAYPSTTSQQATGGPAQSQSETEAHQPSAPTVTRNPADRAVAAGKSATFEASATGDEPMTVRWQSSQDGSDWHDISGAIGSRYVTAPVGLVDSGCRFRAVFRNAAGSDTSATAVLTVTGTAPTIETEVKDTAVAPGERATFTAKAEANPAPTVQWQTTTDGDKWTTIPDASESDYTTPPATAADTGRRFRAVFTNALGTVTSRTAILTVASEPAVTVATIAATSVAPATAGPVITLEPADSTISVGSLVSFVSTATGTPAPTVQWQGSTNGVTWANISGETSTSLSVGAPGVAESGYQYRAVFTNSQGSTTSRAALLTVTPDTNTPPVITAHPQDVTATAGGSATFEATASNYVIMGWFVSHNGGFTWTLLNDSIDHPTYAMNSVTLADDGMLYRALFRSNSFEHAYTNTATLTVNPPAPNVTTDPVDTTVNSGQSATFTAAASGDPTPTVQWQENTGADVSAHTIETWTDIDGATSTTYTTATLTAADTGRQFRAIFTNAGGTDTTQTATLTVTSIIGPPSAPASVTVTAGTSSITVTWTAATANGSPVTGYTATATPAPAACTTTGALSCVIGATAGTSYTVSVVAHSAAGNSAPASSDAVVVPAAPISPPTPPQTSLTLTTNLGHTVITQSGQQLVLIGTGFAQYSTVLLSVYSTPIELALPVTDGNGAFSTRVTLPAGLHSGQHTLVAQGVAPDGTARAMNLVITVTTSADPSLPTTGAAAYTIMNAGLVLTLTGGFLTAIGRRARRPRRTA